MSARAVPFTVQRSARTPRRKRTRADVSRLAYEIDPLVRGFLAERGPTGANRIVRWLLGGAGVNATPSECKAAIDRLAERPGSPIARRAADGRYTLSARP